MDDLLPIGRFARLAGLSVGALRHYDEMDILRPARIDRETGYRSYGRDQLETARTIGRLRDLELSLDEVREYLAADDPAHRRRLVAARRARVDARITRLQRVRHALGHLDDHAPDPLDEGGSTSMTTRSSPDAGLAAADHRQLGVDLFNHVWTLLETADRTPAQVDEMIHAAHASRHHWSFAGTTVNLGRGEWQCSRVYAVLGRAEPALWHAERALAYAEAATAAGHAEAWDVPSAQEAMARAHAVAGDRPEAERWRDLAHQGLTRVEDVEDRQQIEQDLATLPL